MYNNFYRFFLWPLYELQHIYFLLIRVKNIFWTWYNMNGSWYTYELNVFNLDSICTYVDAYKGRHIAEKCPENLKQTMEMSFTLEINELKDAEFWI